MAAAVSKVLSARRAAAFLAALVLAGCAGDDTADTAATDVDARAEAPAAAAAPAGPTRDACTLVTREEVSAATGVDAEGESSSSGSATVCTWQDAQGRSAILQVYGNPNEYERSRATFEDFYDAAADDVSGVGERAFYIAGKQAVFSVGTLSAAEGGTAITVQVMSPTSEDLREPASALARTVLEKL